MATGSVARIGDRMSMPSYDVRFNFNGKFIIFNHRKFAPHLLIGKRSGTENDVKALKKSLKNAGFVPAFQESDGVEHDRTFCRIRGILQYLINVNLEDSASLMVVFLTHANNEGLYAFDVLYPVASIVKEFEKEELSAKLAGKPKIFLLQGSDGIVRQTYNMEDRGLHLPGPGYTTIPLMADFLFAFASFPGYSSVCSISEGSWFIQSFCTMLEKYKDELDLESILLYTKHNVAYENEHENRDGTLFKQMPVVLSSLTKIFCLRNKQ